MLTELQHKLITITNPEDAMFLQRFFKTGPGQYGEGDLFRGIRVPVLRKHSREYLQISLNHVVSLLQSTYHEDRLLALFILVLKYGKAIDDLKGIIYSLYMGNTAFINNWDLVDASAEHLVGAYVSDKSSEPLYQLANSSSMWERRIAILATFHFIKRGKFYETLKIAEILLTDEEYLIHKAVGWMLREVGKRDIQCEDSFLDTHYRQMPRTMLRYAIEKYAQEKRLDYLKRR